MRSRIGLSILLIILALVSQGGAQQTESVSISITSPADGYITVSSEVEIQGVASVTRTGIEIIMVIVSVNGEAQKVALNSDGTFKTTVALENGKNLISAIAITADKELGSAKINVTRQNPMLFFDDFEGNRPNSAWAAGSGTWSIEGGFYVVPQHWADAYTYVLTPDSTSWQDYAVEVNVINAHRTYRAGIVVRAQDHLNKIFLMWQNDSWLCWIVVKNNRGSDCMGQVGPGLTDTVHLRVEVVGDTYTAYVNGIKRTSIQDTTFRKGMPGLMVQNREWIAFDNFKVESLEPGTPTTIAEVPQPLPPQQPAEQTTPSAPTSSTDLQDINNRLNGLEPRVATLETHAEQHGSHLSNLENRISSWGQDISSLKATVANLGGEHQKFTTQVQEIAGRVEVLEKQPAPGLPPDMNARMQAIQQSLATIGQTVKESRAEISELRGELQGAKSSAQLGLMAGIAGAALALLIALGILRL
ncbi:MAG: hypothetical protein A2Z21_02850 [Candidatus Fraserbacteria bacterium RBG_16_55_9]|uniref:Uncharacterized protein n=1 Tax=Fraserbacteria sp. (strain RBG_16_55_9) TaxID=1817864 RepID=A0A1F5UUY0_FRAXR|nr:MAG: hypothetical protein A2Z21_02850 [Candidatus Fraserbacteria bacterium RBG_16_55_9]